MAEQNTQPASGEVYPELHEFNVRLTEYGMAMRHGQSERARRFSEVVASMFEQQLAQSRQASAQSAAPVEKLGVTCMDGGKCHHNCASSCFRRECCGPLTASGLTMEEWVYPNTPPASVPAGDGKDAERYRWLRRFDHFSQVDGMLNLTEFATLDSAVDAAILASKAESVKGDK
jgi:hypothetical protein